MVLTSVPSTSGNDLRPRASQHVPQSLIWPSRPAPKAGVLGAVAFSIQMPKYALIPASVLAVATDDSIRPMTRLTTLAPLEPISRLI